MPAPLRAAQQEAPPQDDDPYAASPRVNTPTVLQGSVRLTPLLLVLRRNKKKKSGKPYRMNGHPDQGQLHRPVRGRVARPRARPRPSSSRALSRPSTQLSAPVRSRPGQDPGSLHERGDMEYTCTACNLEANINRMRGFRHYSLIPSVLSLIPSVLESSPSLLFVRPVPQGEEEVRAPVVQEDLLRDARGQDLQEAVSKGAPDAGHLSGRTPRTGLTKGRTGTGHHMSAGEAAVRRSPLGTRDGLGLWPGRAISWLYAMMLCC